jgi:hypothetical protein
MKFLLVLQYDTSVGTALFCLAKTCIGWGFDIVRIMPISWTTYAYLFGAQCSFRCSAIYNTTHSSAPLSPHHAYIRWY